ncbi:hypothetical protein CC1G_08059 [Coprinopsis cinerea okayama7|uniref:Uncharacterized protein n=1 Tax=Coprinopsis cinerea (strain Okayama-7 / 130 / ATCC MYA-4618 / FGSC 9003) TaxID=240176 RepID=A8NVK8_COPC7|nr:hypothetical protein CC1G_08059 [Coprinopsis cinerea okayama7\|eukprot:XP_001836674.1 hypothetical protein CC1G_08059 [Coprinopsis cinerea okayama7\
MPRLSAELHDFQDPILVPYYPSTNNGLPPDLIPRCTSHLSKMEELVAGKTQEVAQLQDQVNQLIRQIQRAQSEQKVFQDEYTICSSLLAPIRRVPSEILSLIFLHLLGCPKKLRRDYVIQLRDIQRVCKKWRDAAYSTTALWSGLQFLVRWRSGYEESRSVLERWFKRAGKHQRHLEIRWEAHWNHGEAGEDTGIREFLLQPDGNWRSLALLAATHAFVKDLFLDLECQKGHGDGNGKVVESPWSNVEEFEVVFSTHWPSIIPSFTFPASALPSLRRLRIQRQFVPFAHSQLRYLHLDHFIGSAQSLAKTLSMLPNLRELVFSTMRPNYLHKGPLTPNDEPDVDKITVEKLVVTWGRSLDLLDVGLRFPRLKVLHLVDPWVGMNSEGLWQKAGLIGPFLSRCRDVEEVSFAEGDGDMRFHSALITYILHNTRPTPKRILAPDFGLLRSSIKLDESLEEIVARDAPSEKDLRAMAHFFEARKKRNPNSNFGPVKLHVRERWLEYSQEVVERLKDVDVEMVQQPYRDKMWY